MCEYGLVKWRPVQAYDLGRDDLQPLVLPAADVPTPWELDMLRAKATAALAPPGSSRSQGGKMPLSLPPPSGKFLHSEKPHQGGIGGRGQLRNGWWPSAAECSDAAAANRGASF